LAAFFIECPGCKARDTLVYVVSEVKNYPIIAMPSPSNDARGTYHYKEITKHEVARTTMTWCIVPECSFQQTGPMLSNLIVKTAEQPGVTQE
jgi:hypothetical protein